MKSVSSTKVGERRSGQRDAILKVLCSCSMSHPTADDIYLKVRRTFPRISLGTVYRNLNSLIDAGVIKKLSVQNGADRFDSCLHPHVHFTCSKCGDVCDVECRRPMLSTTNLLTSKGYEISDVIINLTGVCPKCAKNNFQTRKGKKK